MRECVQSLVDDMRGCQLCTDLPLGPRPIFKLDAGVRLLIAGQAPGRKAHVRGRPFDDPSGVRLRRWLGVSEAQFYEDPRIGLFPMGLCFPGTGAGGDLPPRAICAATWRAQVMQALGDVQLTLILGAHAIRWHLPDLKGLPVTQAVKAATGDTLVLPHPSPRNNRWLKQNPWFEANIVPQIQTRVRGMLS